MSEPKQSEINRRFRTTTFIIAMAMVVGVLGVSINLSNDLPAIENHTRSTIQSTYSSVWATTQYYDFNRMKADYIEPNWTRTGDPAQGNISLKAAWDSNQTLKVLRSGVGTFDVSVGLLPGNTEMRISFLLGMADTTEYFVLSVITGTALFNVGIYQDKIQVYDGSAQTLYGSVVDNHWYAFNISCNPALKNWTLYVDGTQVCQKSWTGAAVTLTAGKFSPGTTNTIANYVDNFRVEKKFTHSYDDQGFFNMLYADLNYVYDNLYRAGATGKTVGVDTIIDHDDLTLTRPRMVVASTLDMAMEAYMITGDAKWYDMTIDLGRWFVDVCQQSQGYYEFTGGSGDNPVNNSLTTAEVAGTMVRLYNMTKQSIYLSSAYEGINYLILNSWNDTTKLFRDYPLSAKHRVNFNANIAANLAFTYYITGNASLLPYIQSIMDQLPTYMMTPADQAYPRYYPYWITDLTPQGQIYNFYTAQGLAAACYYTNLTGNMNATWLTNLTYQMDHILHSFYFYTDGLGSIAGMSTAEYIGSFTPVTLYYLLTRNEIYGDLLRLATDYVVNRATHLQNANGSLPLNCYNDAALSMKFSAFSLGYSRYLSLWDDSNLVIWPNHQSVTGFRAFVGDPNEVPFTCTMNEYGQYSYSRFVSTNSTYLGELSVSLGQVNCTVLEVGATIKWIANSSGSVTVTFTLLGLTTGMTYKVYIDSVIMATIVAVDSQISFDYSSWSTHTFDVVVPVTYESPDEVTPPPSDKSPATSDAGTTSLTWTSLTMIAIACVSLLVVLVLLLRRPRGRSGTRHS